MEFLRRVVPPICFLVLTAVALLAITTVSVNLKCPICGTENELGDYASWGSYVYQWPSKFQMVFFPYDSSTTVYHCKKCHLSAYMWDWKEIPKDKMDAVRAALANTTLSGNYSRYTQIPVSEKLQIAEKVYRILGKDDEFWAHFYRVLGYHLDLENHPAEARVARLKALELTEKALNDPAKKERRKEYLVITASLNHFLDHDDIATRQLNEALTLHWVNPTDKEKSKGFDDYLTGLAKEYIEKIQTKSVPKGNEVKG